MNLLITREHIIKIISYCLTFSWLLLPSELRKNKGHHFSADLPCCIKKQQIILTLKETFINEKMGSCFHLLSTSFCSPCTGQLHWSDLSWKNLTLFIVNPDFTLQCNVTPLPSISIYGGIHINSFIVFALFLRTGRNARGLCWGATHQG
jgi:hypothetical protein